MAEEKELQTTIDDEIRDAINNALSQINHEDSLWLGNDDATYLERETGERQAYFIYQVPDKEGSYYNVLIAGKTEDNTCNATLNRFGSNDAQSKNVYVLEIRAGQILPLSAERDSDKDSLILTVLRDGKKVPIIQMTEEVTPAIQAGRFDFESYIPKQSIDAEYSIV